ncbi:hypothetical protein OEZ86_007938 [Tetradesmus obliquus]|nr:hypothetical protein OEZ86_007938 [Tetradesmus obliquus]
MVAARVSVAVTLAASAGCLGVFSGQLLGSGLNLRCALDGALAGLVAISASCAVVEMYAAFVIGLLGGAAYLAGLRLVRLLQVDDPVHVTAVHLLPGIWGAIAPGIFATPALLPAVGYPAPAGSSGIFYKGDGKQLGIQLLGALVVFLWSLALSLALFAALKLLKLLRVPAASEGIGGLALAW